MNGFFPLYQQPIGKGIKTQKVQDTHENLYEVKCAIRKLNPEWKHPTNYLTAFCERS